LDTSGCASEKSAEEILPLVDLLLLDLKSFDAENYFALTKSKIERPLSTLRVARKLKIPTRVRFVLVPNLTDDLPQIKKMAAFLKEHEVVEKVEVLPFHKQGEQKWQNLGYEYKLSETPPPSDELLHEVQKIFEE
jgi:pyruvate formate lyase activating enzyme